MIIFAFSLGCINSFRSVPPFSWRNIRLHAAPTDGADDTSNEKGKNGDKNSKNTSGNDAGGNEEPIPPPLKMPRAMIKPITDENEQSSPPEQFDSGIGSKNKSSRRSLSRAAAEAALKMESGGVDSVKNNWKFGLCKHRIAFEATETIKRMRFKDNRLCFAMTDGKVCVVDMTTGDILSRYFEHTGEISALDYDGERLCSGGLDGVVNIYNTHNINTAAVSSGDSSDTSTSTPKPQKRGRPRTFAESDIKFSDVLALEMMATTTTATATTTTATATKAVPEESASSGGKGQQQQRQRQQVVLESLHTKQVTGMRLLPSSKNKNNNGTSSAPPLSVPPPLMVTCGLDKKLVCVDVSTGSTVYAVTLDATPICLDVDAQVIHPS